MLLFGLLRYYRSTSHTFRYSTGLPWFCNKIGIGSGPDCDGQILVTPDLIGTYPWFTPKFVKQELDAATQIRAAVGRWQAAL